MTQTKYRGREWKRTRRSMAQDYLRELREDGLTEKQVVELVTLILQEATRNWDLGAAAKEPELPAEHASEDCSGG